MQTKFLLSEGGSKYGFGSPGIEGKRILGVAVKRASDPL